MVIRIGVLASGRGSNFQALINNIEKDSIPASIAVLVVNREGAKAVHRAEEHGIPHRFVEHRGRSRGDFERELIRVLDGFEIDLIVLAGFMRILTPVFVEHFQNQIINVHPALLPSFPGAHGQRDALEHGVKVSGCSVHFVNTDVDGGPIILQRCVPVLENDTEETLSTRILKEEHVALPEAVSLYARGLLRVDGRRVRILENTKS